MIRDITEVETDKPAWRCCPLMSGRPVPIATPVGVVLGPNQTAIGPMIVPCAEEECPWFDVPTQRCVIFAGCYMADALRNLSTLAESDLRSMADSLENLHVLAVVVEDLKMVLEPATNSPIGAIADAFSEIVKLLKSRKG